MRTKSYTIPLFVFTMLFLIFMIGCYNYLQQSPRLEVIHSLEKELSPIIKKLKAEGNEIGEASYYSRSFQGATLKSGEKYDENKLTAAHRTLPFGSIVKVIRTDNESSVLVRINDNGPFISGRIIEMTTRAAEKIDLLEDGVTQVVLVNATEEEKKQFLQLDKENKTPPKVNEKIVPIKIGETDIGLASYYANSFHGTTTANGEKYDKNKFTAAHKTLPFGTVITVERIDNGKTIDVIINDRGPFIKNRIIDLSRIAADKIDLTDAGVSRVKIQIASKEATHNFKKQNLITKQSPIQKKIKPAPRGQTEIGTASYYHDSFQGKKTASGEKYDKTKLTGAHKILPFGTIIRVERLDNGKTIDVVINDRGPYVNNLILEISKSAAEKIDLIKDGSVKVKITTL